MSRGGIVIRRPFALLGLGLLAVSATACSSGSNIKLDESATTVAPVAVTAAPTTSAAATTVPDTIPTATEVPAATEAPTTTISLEDQVRGGTSENFAARDACLIDPVSCDVATFTVPGSREAERMQKLVDRNAAEGLISLIIPELNTFVIEDIQLGVDQRSAVVTMCVVNGNWVMDSMGTADTADDVPVNTALASSRVESLLELTEGRWRWATYLGAGTWDDVTTCAD
jgi:hypothetical protein